MRTVAQHYASAGKNRFLQYGEQLFNIHNLEIAIKKYRDERVETLYAPESQ